MVEASVSHPAAPSGRTIGRLAAKLAVTAGLVAIGWLVAAALSTSASAGEPGPAAAERASEQAAGAGLTRLLGRATKDTSEITDSTVASVNSTVTSVAKSTEDTVGTVTKTVDGTRSTVSAVTDSVNDTVTRTVDRTVGTVTDTVDSVPGGLAPVVGELEQGTAAGEPATAPVTADQAATSASEPAARTAKETARQSKPAPAGPLSDTTPAAALDNAERPASGSTKASAAAGRSGEREAPAAPAAPGFAVAQAASDTAAGKNHHATLADATTETQLRLSGTSNCRSVFGAKSDPALPCTTPD